MKKLIFTLISLISISLLSPSPTFAIECSPGYDPYVLETTEGIGLSTPLCVRFFPPPPCGPTERRVFDASSGQEFCAIDPLNNQALPGSSLECAGFIACLAGIGLPGLQSKFPSEQGLVGNLISAVIPVILVLAGFLTAIFIVISGIQFITSGGDPKGAAAAKDRLVYALIGFVLIILAFAILQIIDRVFLGGTGVA